MAARKGEPGHAKAGGRQKGTPNKKTQDLLLICEEEGINPFRALLRLTTHHDIVIQIQALKEVCQYIYPKRKAIEVSADLKAEVDIKGNAYLDEVMNLFSKAIKERK